MNYAFSDHLQIEDLEEFGMFDLTEEICSTMDLDLWDDLSDVPAADY